jgi:hypothetical protein
MVDLQEIEAIKRLKYGTCAASTRSAGTSWLRASPRTPPSPTARKFAFAGRDAIAKFLVDSMDRASFLQPPWAARDRARERDHRDRDLGAQDTVIDTHFEITLRGAAFYRDST